MDITPATLSQVVQGRGGNYITIENDVCDIARRLKEVNDSLTLRYNEQGCFFAVIQVLENGDENLVTTAQEADERLVQRVRRVTHPSYDYGAELERQDAENDRVKNQQFNEKVGEVSERLAHAVREDLRKGLPGPVYVPPDLYRNNRRK
jgi:hypothetical protein